jgi:hypothetical protein
MYAVSPSFFLRHQQPNLPDSMAPAAWIQNKVKQTDAIKASPDYNVKRDGFPANSQDQCISVSGIRP